MHGAPSRRHDSADTRVWGWLIPRSAMLLVLGSVSVNGCGSAREDAARTGLGQTPKRPEARAQAPQATENGEVLALPLGVAPPLAGTHFVDVTRATTTLRVYYPSVQYHLPWATWPPAAYTHGLGMRVRWWASHSWADASTSAGSPGAETATARPTAVHGYIRLHLLAARQANDAT